MDPAAVGDGPAQESGRGLSRNVRALSWVSFFQDAASEMLYPVLPLFLTTVLGAPIAVVGLIEGVAEGTASVMKAVSGRLADMRERRPLIAVGYGISSVSKLLIGFATGWGLVLFARFADRFGKGVRTSPRDAILAGEADAANRGRVFGFHRAMDTAGAVVGPLVGLAAYELLNHELRPLFFIAFVPAAISVGLIFLVHDSRVAPAPDRLRLRGAGPLPRRYWRLLVVLTMFGLVNFSDAFLILRAKELGLGFASVILAYAAYNVSYAALSYPAGVVSDRLSRRVVFATGLAIFAIAYIGLGLANRSVWVWLLLPLYGGYTALTDGVSKAWVSDLLPETLLGTGLGLFQGTTGGAALIAGIWAGLAWGGDGRGPLIVSGAIVAVLAVALLIGGRRLDPNPSADGQSA